MRLVIACVVLIALCLPGSAGAVGKSTVDPNAKVPGRWFRMRALRNVSAMRPSERRWCLFWPILALLLGCSQSRLQQRGLAGARPADEYLR